MKRPPDARFRAAVLALLAAVVVSSSTVAGQDEETRTGGDPAARDARQGSPRAERPYRIGPAELTLETIEECLQVAEAIDEKLGTRLRELREKQPGEFSRRLRRMRRLLEMVELKRRDPSQYQLELLDLKADANVNRLAGELRAARDGRRTAEAEAIAARLRGGLRLQIALDHKAREDYVCQLRELFTRLEDELVAERNRIEADGDRIVDERLEALANESVPVADDGASAHRSGRLEVEPTAGGDILTGITTGVWGDRLPGRPRRGLPVALTPERVDEYMLVAREIDAELALRLQALSEKAPEKLAGRLRLMRRLTDFVELKRRDPNLYQLKLLELHVDDEVSRLAADLREAKHDGRAAEAQALAQQLRWQLRLQLAFDFHAQDAYVSRLRELVVRLEEEQLQARQRLVEHPDEVIEERLEELVRPPGAPTFARPGAPRGGPAGSRSGPPASYGGAARGDSSE